MQMKRKSTRHIKILGKYFLSFALLIVLAIAIYTALYTSAKNTITNSAVNMAANRTKYFAYIMDDVFDEVYSVIQNTQNNETLLNIDRSGEFDAITYYKIQEYIISDITPKLFVYDAVFFIEETNTIVNSGGTFDADNYFNKYLYNESKNLYFWKDYLSSQKEQSVIPSSVYSISNQDAGRQKELIAIIAPRALFQNIRVMVLADADEIKNLFTNEMLIFDSDELIYFNEQAIPKGTDSDFHINVINGLTEGYNKVQIKEEEHFLFWQRSEYFDWYYANIISEQTVFSSLASYNATALVLIGILIVIGVVISYFLSLRFYNPIQKFSNLLLNKEAENGHEIQYDMQMMYERFKDVFTKYDNIHKEYDLMKRFHKMFLYEKMINRVDLYELDDLFAFNPEDDTFDNFVILAYSVFYRPSYYQMDDFDFSDYGRIGLDISLLVQQSIEEKAVHSFQVRQNDYVNIIALKDEHVNYNSFLDKAKKIFENDDAYFYIRFAISDIYHGVNDLGIAYDDAQNLFDYFTVNEETDIIFNELADRNLENMLITHSYDKIKELSEAGLLNELKDEIKSILHDMESKNTLLMYVKNSFTIIFSTMLNHTPVHNAKENEFINEINKKIAAASTKSEFDEIIGLMISCVKRLREGEPKSANRPILHMIEYINTYYYQDLYLGFFSDKYKMSTVYLSKLFKSHAGLNFSDYLRHVRLEKAKHLLRTTDMKVKELAEKVGYLDANHFIKTFKKQYGVTPGEFRKVRIIKEIDNEA